ncbi:MAG TPA: hypothetical protein VKU36_03615 [Candidatus Babeliales bacterium]|nr:hypothetical protein [Candidatus Babeliales bacterium]
MKNSIIFSLSLLFTFPSIQGMLSYAQQQKQLIAFQAKEYNKNNKNITFIDNFIKLPSDVSRQIINIHYSLELSEEIATTNTDHHNLINNLNTMEPFEVSRTLTAIEHVVDKKAFVQSIKKYMQLRGVCTHFNEVLTPQIIGFLHKHHDLDQKNELWRELMANPTYSMTAKSLPAVILICAGATNNTHINALLQHITANNKVQQAEILFQHGIDPNLQYDGIPVFFAAPTIEMIKTFMTYGANIHAETNKWPTFKKWNDAKEITHMLQVKNQSTNVLWHILDNKYGSELMEFYISCGISPKKQYTQEPLSGAFCILHEFANPYYAGHLENRCILKKGEILLKSMPEMVNLQDSFGRTPLDIALESLRKIGHSVEELDQIRLGCPTYSFFSSFESFARDFVALLRKYKAKTAEELKCFLF